MGLRKSSRAWHWLAAFPNYGSLFTELRKPQPFKGCVTDTQPVTDAQPVHNL